MANRQEWAEWAVSGILLPKERESARQELLDHIEDHMEALMSAGFSRWEAEQQAVTAMGNPEDTAKLLRKAHQPVLTRILQAARVCCITLAVIAALALFVSFVKKDDLLPGWFDGKPFAPDQEWLFGQPADDSILFRRVCQPEARMQVGDYTLKIHKVAVDQRENSHFLVGGQAFDFGAVAFWGHRQGGSYYSWFYLELPEEPDGLTLELPCEDKTYALKIDLKGGETYEKAH